MMSQDRFSWAQYSWTHLSENPDNGRKIIDISNKYEIIKLVNMEERFHNILQNVYWKALKVANYQGKTEKNMGFKTSFTKDFFYFSEAYKDLSHLRNSVWKFIIADLKFTFLWGDILKGWKVCPSWTFVGIQVLTLMRTLELLISFSISGKECFFRSEIQDSAFILTGIWDDTPPIPQYWYFYNMTMYLNVVWRGSHFLLFHMSSYKIFQIQHFHIRYKCRFTNVNWDII